MHGQGSVCLTNVLLFQEVLLDGEIEAANEHQRNLEAAARKRGERRSFTGVLCRQTFGPLCRFVIPLTHSRQSRYPPFRKALKCTQAARVVDYEVLRCSLLSGEGAENDIPIDLLPEYVL